MSLKCPLCDEVFASWKLMNKHIRAKHKEWVKLAKLEHPKRET
ncbi:MAG: C2H2-type zinc finger protein [Candidatus Bathyarchaeia archaeon]